MISYDTKYFNPFETARIIKDIIPEYIWVMDEGGDVFILPSHGKSYEKLKYIFAKEKKLNPIAHATLNELGVEKMNKDLSLFSSDDFFPFEDHIKLHYRKSGEQTYYGWFLDWSRGRDNYKVVIDIFVRPYLYVSDTEPFDKKRVFIFDAYPLADKRDEHTQAILLERGYGENQSSMLSNISLRDAIDSITDSEIADFDFKLKQASLLPVAEPVLEALESPAETPKSEEPTEIKIEEPIVEKKEDNSFEGFTFTF